jgi:hypothetical protein
MRMQRVDAGEGVPVVCYPFCEKPSFILLQDAEFTEISW